MVVVGLGGNLESAAHGCPANTLEAALTLLAADDCHIVRRSRWYESSPVPPSDQPWYVNGVAELETSLTPDCLLARLHRVEDRIGRVRTTPNAARIVDLDLLVFGEKVLSGPPGPIVPHPRLHERAFVLLPLRELLPDWTHPRTGQSIEALIRGLPADQICRPLDRL